VSYELADLLSDLVAQLRSDENGICEIIGHDFRPQLTERDVREHRDLNTETVKAVYCSRCALAKRL
jgi:hypothetical protein